MADVFQLVEEDLSTTLVDLNDLVGGSTGIKIKGGIDTGSVELNNEYIQQTGAPGATVAATNVPVTAMGLRLKVQHNSRANILAKLRALAKALQRGGVIKRQFDGDAAAQYAVFYPSPIPAALNGGYPEFQYLDNHTVVELPVVIYRFPYWNLASASLTPTPSSGWTNEVGNRELKVTNPGSMPSPCKITATFPEAGADVVQLRIGRKSGLSADLLDFASLCSFEVEGATLTNSTSSTADANASGGNMARTSYSATGYFLKRWKKVITPGTVNDLVGTYRVYCVLKFKEGSEQTIQLRWGMNNSDPVDYVNEKVPLNGSDLSSSIYVPVDLGEVRFDDTAASLVLEGWSQLDTDPGSSTLDWDSVVLIPCDEQFTTISVPGFRGMMPGLEKWTGDLLTTPTQPAGLTAGTVDETTVKLNTTDDAVGTKPNAGVVLPAGKHIVTVLATIKDDNGGVKTKLGELRVRNITDNVNAATKSLYSQKNRRETEVEKSLVFDADGSDNFQLQVVATDVSDYQKIIVREVHHSFVRTVGNGLKLVISSIDPEDSGVYSGTTKIASVWIAGPLIELPPGDSTLVFDIGDWSGLHYQDDVDIREPLPKSVAARQATYAVEVEERHAPL